MVRNRCIDCGKAIERSYLYTCDTCEKPVCTKCAKYVSISIYAQDREYAIRFCQRCDVNG